MMELRSPRRAGAQAASRAPAPFSRVALMRPLALAVALTLALPPAPLLAQTAAPARRPAAASDDQATLNFVNADLEATVRAVGQYTGRQFVIDPRVKGTINLVTEKPVTKQQAFEQLLSALRLQGFTIVETPGGVSRILPEADAKLQGGRVVTPQETAPRGDQVITQVFELQYESATNMVPVLRPLIAPNNTISAYPANNTLVITDYADNLRRLREIIASIDRPGSADAEIVPLKHGLALEIATVANRVLDEGARAAGQANDGGQRVQVLAESRTNSLILRAASPARAYAARQLIEKLDQPSVTPGNINVIYLRNAQAVPLAQTLRAVISGDPSFLPQVGNTGGLSSTAGSSGSGFGSSSSSSGLSSAIGSGMQQSSNLGGTPAAAATASGTTGSGSSGGALAGLIQADAATNSLIITAPEPLFRNIRAIIEKLDVRPAQVVIESLIAEVTADKVGEMGIQWQSLSGLNSSGTRVIGGTNFGSSGTNIITSAADLTSLGTGLNIGVIRGTVTIGGTEILNLGVLARALETNANANILSQPNIQTLDNEEAKFLVGQNVPFITGSYTTNSSTSTVNPYQTYERKDIGLQLRVKPQVSEGGVVRLAIYLEISSVQSGTTTTGIITNKRAFESTVLVEDGNYVVLSGLIEDRTDNSESRVPLLGSLPFIGAFFRYQNRERHKTNTMVFLRPKVIRSEQASSALAADRYDYMRTQLEQTQTPDNWVLRGYQGNELPPYPVVVPQAPTPAPGEVPPPMQRDVPVLTAPPAERRSATQGPAPAGASPRADGTVATAARQVIQVAQVADAAQARELQRQLRAAGFDAYWESLRAPDRAGEVVRVRVAVDGGAEALTTTLAALRARGFDAVPVAP